MFSPWDLPTFGDENSQVAQLQLQMDDDACLQRDRGRDHYVHQEHQDVTLELHADVADWNPNSGFQRLLAVGTYELDEETRSRHGKLYTYEVDLGLDTYDGDSPTSTRNASLRLVHTVDNLPGIFDLQFIPTGSSAVSTPSCALSSTMVALALSDGTVRIVDACCGDEAARSVAEEAGAPAMALFVDTLVSPDLTSLAVSYSDGCIHVLNATPDGRLVETRSWEAHSLEAWMATWSRSPSRRGNVIYSGGDDAIFQAWDLREANSGDATPARLFLDRKSHGAGVTCITELPRATHDTNGGTETTVVTGSYDNTLRIWDWRNTSKPVLQTSFGMGGGVWRVKPHPRDPSLLLAATMYDGFKVVKVSDVLDEVGVAIDGSEADPCHRRLVAVEQVVQYPAEGSLTDKTLAYGASWCHAREAMGLAATCSFYDNRLSLWSLSS